jgi:predicted secreted protein
MRIACALAAAAVAALAAGCGDSRSGGSTSERLVAVHVFFPRGNTGIDCSRVHAVRRAVEPPAVLAGALRELLAGPTPAERTRGYGGWFSSRTAHAFRRARIAHGVAYVDFRNFSRTIPNASSSCGSALLLAQLDRTAKQFPAVRRAVYSFNGSRRAFYEWLQLDVPRVTTAASAVIHLTRRDDGRTVRARTGDALEVRLAANASTGFVWRFTARGSPVLRLVSARYVPGTAKPGLVGVPGTYLARLAVRAPGRARLALVYARSTTPATPPARRFRVDVVARR